MKKLSPLYQDAIDLLCQLIQTPSFSRAERATSELIEDFLITRDVSVERSGNNIWAFAAPFDRKKATIWLN